MAQSARVSDSPPVTLAGALRGWFGWRSPSSMTPLMNIVVRDTGESVRLRPVELAAALATPEARRRGRPGATLRSFGSLAVVCPRPA